MSTFIYTNYKTKNVIKITAKDISEADKVYQKMTGETLIKANHIGCEVIKCVH